MSLIHITHNMDGFLRLADHVTVLKDGYRRGTYIVKDLDKYRLFQLTYSFAAEFVSTAIPIPYVGCHSM
jgi:ABC-type sugar transport system ATPase subunit